MLRRARVSFILAPVLCCTTCKREEAPQPPPEYFVPVRVVIFLDQGEQVGIGTNFGCRLTNPQIEQYMQQLDKLAPQFGANIKFSYSLPAEIMIRNIPTRNVPITFWNDVIMRHQGGEPNWHENKINLYFTGNIFGFDENFQPIQQEAGTLDPADVTCETHRHYIFINDRAHEATDAPGIVIPTARILEHEMCHFLLRQRNARYNNVEHDPDEAATHLMKAHFPHGPIHALDAAEIKQRIQSGGVLPTCF